jgi:hypothetical protein
MNSRCSTSSKCRFFILQQGISLFAAHVYDDKQGHCTKLIGAGGITGNVAEGSSFGNVLQGV